MRKQSLPLALLPWHNKWTKYSTPTALVLCIVILFTSGFPVFTRGNWSTSGFVASYLDIPLVFTAFVAWKTFKKTEFVRLEDIALREALEEIVRSPEETEPVKKGREKWIGVLWD